jgi:hypothetical protein
MSEDHLREMLAVIPEREKIKCRCLTWMAMPL